MTTTTSAAGLTADVWESCHPILRLIPLVATHPVVFVLTVASIVFHQVCSIGAVVTGAVIVGQVASGTSLAGIQGWLLVLALLVIGRSAGHWAEMWIAHDLAFRLLITIRMRVYDGVERTAPGGLLDRRTGDLANGALSDVETLEWFYAHTIGNLLAAVLVPAAALVVLGSVDPRLAFVLAPALLVVGTAPFTLRRLADRQGARLKERLATVHAEVVDGVQGLRELVAFGRGPCVHPAARGERAAADARPDPRLGRPGARHHRRPGQRGRHRSCRGAAGGVAGRTVRRRHLPLPGR